MNSEELVGRGLLDNIIAEQIEAAYREGWRTGYGAGYADGRSDFDYGDLEDDWQNSAIAKTLRARAAIKEGDA